MRFFSVLSILLSVAFVATTSLADVNQIGVTLPAPETIKEMQPGDVMVLVNAGIEAVRRAAAESESLSQNQRLAMESEIDDARAALLDFYREIARWSGSRVIGGVVVTYGLDGGLPAPFVPQLGVGIAGEVGGVLFLSNDPRPSEWIRFSDAFVFSTKVGAATNPRETRASVEPGWNFRVLFGAGGSDRPAINLKDFEGVYAGGGMELKLFGNNLLPIRVHGKAFTCRNANPFDCQIYVATFSPRKRGDVWVGANVNLQGFYLDFPHDNDGRGFRPFQ